MGGKIRIKVILCAFSYFDRAKKIFCMQIVVHISERKIGES